MLHFRDKPVANQIVKGKKNRKHYREQGLQASIFTSTITRYNSATFQAVP